MIRLLCLLSDQHIPNLLSVHLFTPDRLVLVATKEMTNRVAWFLNALRLSGQDYTAPERHSVIRLTSDDSLTVIRTALQGAFDQHPQDDWIANITCGTKPMSIGTYEFFKERGGRLVYTNLSRPAEIRDVITDATLGNCSYRPRIKEFLAGYGFAIRTSDERIEVAKRRALSWKACAARLAARAGPDDLLPLDNAERTKARDRGADLTPDQLTKSLDAETRAELIREFWPDGPATRKLTKYEVQFLTGGWLEVFFWNLLGDHAPDLGIWDVRLGLLIGQDRTEIMNDLDVAFMHEYGLTALECKSGVQGHDAEADILYKVETVVRQTKALRVRTILATTGENILDKATRTVKKSFAERAELYQCRILTADRIRALAAPTVSADAIRSALFGHPPSPEPREGT